MSKEKDSNIPYDEIDVISVVDIQFDKYQRGLSQDWVDELARKWNDDLCDPIVVSLRKNGAYYCIAGQHRVKAAMKAGVKELFARVLTGLTYEQEADYFYQGQKNQRGMRPTDAWNASLEAKHSNTVEINTIVENLGGKVNRHPDPEKGINCPGRLWKIHEYAGKQVLYDALDLINDAWPSYKLGGIVTEASMISGAMFFVFNHGDEIKRERLIKNLSKVNPLAIRDVGRRYKDLGRTTDEGFYLAILDIYNKGLTEASRMQAKKCDWRTVKATHKRAEFEAKQLRKANVV